MRNTGLLKNAMEGSITKKVKGLQPLRQTVLHMTLLFILKKMTMVGEVTKLILENEHRIFQGVTNPLA